MLVNLRAASERLSDFGTFFVPCCRRRCRPSPYLQGHSEPRQQNSNLPSTYASVRRMCPPDNLVKSNGNITSHAAMPGTYTVYLLYIYFHIAKHAWPVRLGLATCTFCAISMGGKLRPKADDGTCARWLEVAGIA